MELVHDENAVQFVLYVWTAAICFVLFHDSALSASYKDLSDRPCHGPRLHSRLACIPD